MDDNQIRKTLLDYMKQFSETPWRLNAYEAQRLGIKIIPFKPGVADRFLFNKIINEGIMCEYKKRMFNPLYSERDRIEEGQVLSVFCLSGGFYNYWWNIEKEIKEAKKQ
jgi:hypothetical protein